MNDFDRFLSELTELTKKHGRVIEWTVFGMMLGLSTGEFNGYTDNQQTFEWNRDSQRYERK